MSIKQDEIPLVDVVALSFELCQHPLVGDLKYSTNENFLGRPVDGYNTQVKDICLLAREAGFQLCQAQNYLNKNFGYGLIIFDAYRPQRAVKDFVNWFHTTPTAFELQRKEIHYPHLQKEHLSDLGYIAASVSRHSLGQAVDLTLINLNSGELLPMGTGYDFFDELSHSSCPKDKIGDEAHQNRSILTDALERFGFKVHAKEWWHFDFERREVNEPLDIPIEPSLRGLGCHTGTGQSGE